MADIRLESLSRADWKSLRDYIKKDRCTPFLGAGACVPTLSVGNWIANDWARDYEYPLPEGRGDLTRVAQFLSVHRNAHWPKELILERFRTEIQTKGRPDFREETEIHGVLARLNLSIYLTTNYDDFMFEALKAEGKKPKRDFFRWHPGLAPVDPLPGQPASAGLPSPAGAVPDEPPLPPSVFTSGYQPTPEEPLVFHLHGVDTVPKSLVLTEDDYFDFLVNWSFQKNGGLPPKIQECLVSNSLLFVGYAIADWNFRVIFRAVNTLGYMQRSLLPAEGEKHISIQLLPGKGRHRKQMIEYLRRYYDRLKVRVFWGRCDEFCTRFRDELRDDLAGGR